MNQKGCQLFSRSAFAIDQHRRIDPRDLFNAGKQFGYRDAVANHQRFFDIVLLKWETFLQFDFSFGMRQGQGKLAWLDWQ